MLVASCCVKAEKHVILIFRENPSQDSASSRSTEEKLVLFEKGLGEATWAKETSFTNTLIKED